MYRNMNPQNDGIFPEEVVLEILARLPIKSLHRSKTVCKQWQRLCSDEYLVELYNNNNNNNNPTLLLDLSDSLISVDHALGVSDLSLSFLKDRVRVRASCNGLLCCSSVPDKGLYYVCNPFTRQFKLLPRTPHPDAEPTLVGLACHRRNRFCVVLAGTFVCSVFDSAAGKWRKFESFWDDHRRFSHINKNQAVFVKRSLHWLTWPFILALDLACDSWRELSLPEEVSEDRSYLLELDGGLSVVHISESWMSIWVLKEDWELVERVSLRCIRGLVPGIFPICQSKEVVFLATHKQVLVYHRRTRVWKEMYSLNSGSALPLWFSAHAFRTTILSCT